MLKFRKTTCTCKEVSRNENCPHISDHTGGRGDGAGGVHFTFHSFHKLQYTFNLVKMQIPTARRFLYIFFDLEIWGKVFPIGASLYERSVVH